ncbi:hypothetical protein R6Q59_016946 [Mikania micrantha]
MACIKEDPACTCVEQFIHLLLVAASRWRSQTFFHTKKTQLQIQSCVVTSYLIQDSFLQKENGLQ